MLETRLCTPETHLNKCTSRDKPIDRKTCIPANLPETHISITRERTWNTLVADFKVGGEVAWARTHLSKSFIRNKEPTVLLTRTRGVHIRQDVRGAADGTVWLADAPAWLHAPVLGGRHYDHLVSCTGDVGCLPLTIFSRLWKGQRSNSAIFRQITFNQSFNQSINFRLMVVGLSPGWKTAFELSIKRVHRIKGSCFRLS